MSMTGFGPEKTSRTCRIGKTWVSVPSQARMGSPFGYDIQRAEGEPKMGLTFWDVSVIDPGRPDRERVFEFLVDSGAVEV